MALRIGNGRRRIRAYGRLDGSAARAFLHGKVQAANEKKSNAQRERADSQGDKHRRNNCEFHRRGALLVEAQGFQPISHVQPNLMSDVLLIGVGKVLLILMPGNIGV